MRSAIDKTGTLTERRASRSSRSSPARAGVDEGELAHTLGRFAQSSADAKSDASPRSPTTGHGPTRRSRARPCRSPRGPALERCRAARRDDLPCSARRRALPARQPAGAHRRQKRARARRVVAFGIGPLERVDENRTAIDRTAARPSSVLGEQAAQRCARETGRVPPDPRVSASRVISGEQPREQSQGRGPPTLGSTWASPIDGGSNGSRTTAGGRWRRPPRTSNSGDRPGFAPEDKKRIVEGSAHRPRAATSRWIGPNGAVNDVPASESGAGFCDRAGPAGSQDGARGRRPSLLVRGDFASMPARSSPKDGKGFSGICSAFTKLFVAKSAFRRSFAPSFSIGLDAAGLSAPAAANLTLAAGFDDRHSRRSSSRSAPRAKDGFSATNGFLFRTFGPLRGARGHSSRPSACSQSFRPRPRNVGAVLPAERSAHDRDERPCASSGSTSCLRSKATGPPARNSRRTLAASDARPLRRSCSSRRFLANTSSRSTSPASSGVFVILFGAALAVRRAVAHRRPVRAGRPFSR